MSPHTIGSERPPQARRMRTARWVGGLVLRRVTPKVGKQVASGGGQAQGIFWEWENTCKWDEVKKRPGAVTPKLELAPRRTGLSELAACFFSDGPVHFQYPQIVSLEKFLVNAHELVDQLSGALGRVILTRHNNTIAGVQSSKEHQRWREALLLKRIVQSEKRIPVANVREQNRSSGSCCNGWSPRLSE